MESALLVDERSAGRAVSPPASPRRDRARWIVIGIVGAALGASPFMSGLYPLSWWGPAGLLVLGLLFACGLGLAWPRLPWPPRAALAGLGGLAVWSLISTAWAESADRALTGGAQWAVYAAALALLLLVVRDERVAGVLLGLVGLGALAVAGWVLVRMRASDPSGLFIEGRLNDPLGYVNGEGCFFLLATWIGAGLAEQSRRPALAGAGAAAAGLFASLALMSVARGAALGAIVSAVCLVALLPGRARRAWLILVVGGVLVALSGPIAHVYDSSQSGNAAPAADVVHRAALQCLAVALAAGVVWAAAVAAVEAAGRRGPGSAALARRWSGWALVALAAIALIVAAVSAGRIVHRVDEQRKAFVNLGSDSAGGRLLSGGGNRHDFWRIALDEFRDHPIGGVGAGNYDRYYFLERRTTQPVTQPHSIELQTLAELGVVGAALLAALFAGLLGGLWRAAQTLRQRPGARGLIVAAGGGLVAWMVDTSVDWLHIVPGLVGVVLCFAAALYAVGSGPSTAGAPVLSRRRLAAMALGTVLIAGAATLVSSLTLADRYRTDAQSAVRDDPLRGLRLASRSLSLNGESVSAYYVRSDALARLGRYARARGSLLTAAGKEPHNYVTWALLGELAVRQGDLARARAAFARASRLNPREKALERLARDPRSRESAQ